MIEKTLEELMSDMTDQGYLQLRVIPGHGLCGIKDFMFTIGLCLGLDEEGYRERYCYPKENVLDAVTAAVYWDGEGYPPGRWVKRKGVIEESNPNLSNMKIEERIVRDSDIGAQVTYIPDHAKGDASHKDSERGFITSFTDEYVFVRFSGSTSQRCSPKNLVWG